MKEQENRNIFTYDCLGKPEPEFRKASGKEDKFFTLPEKAVLNFNPTEESISWAKKTGIKGNVHINPPIIICKKTAFGPKNYAIENFPPSGSNYIFEAGRTRPVNLKKLIAEKVEQGWKVTEALQKALSIETTSK